VHFGHQGSSSNAASSQTIALRRPQHRDRNSESSALHGAQSAVPLQVSRQFFVPFCPFLSSVPFVCTTNFATFSMILMPGNFPDFSTNSFRALASALRGDDDARLPSTGGEYHVALPAGSDLILSSGGFPPLLPVFLVLVMSTR
jgi:hypothetical protein